MASPSDHGASIIDGKAIAQTIRAEIAAEVHQLSLKYGKVSLCLSLSLGLKVVAFYSRGETAIPFIGLLFRVWGGLPLNKCHKHGVKFHFVDDISKIRTLDICNSVFWYFPLYTLYMKNINLSFNIANGFSIFGMF